MFRRKVVPVVHYERSQNLIDLAFIHENLDRAFRFIGACELYTAAPTLGDLRWLGRVALRRQSDHADEALVVRRDRAVHLFLDRKREHMSVAVGARADRGLIESLRRELRARFIPATPTDLVPVLFWGKCEYGGRSSRRMIDCPGWHSVHSNYPSAPRVALAPLLAPSFRPAAGGKLVLWHGPPGTGKTTALRALASEWAPWCSTELILDPEAFLDDADYLMDVLLENDDEQPADPRWRLLVLEDTGEMLNVDAKLRQGQRLSRLLNTVDGLIGHGMRLLVLVTTNELLETLHPAVARPGRCIASIEFTSFPWPRPKPGCTHAEQTMCARAQV